MAEQATDNPAAEPNAPAVAEPESPPQPTAITALPTSPQPLSPVFVKQVLHLRTLDDFVQLAQVLFAGGCQPKSVDRPAKLVPMLIAGAELGFNVMQSLKWLTPPVNGACAIWGDAGLALIIRSGLLEYREVTYSGSGDDRECTVRLIRRGVPDSRERTYSYSLAIGKRLKSFKIAGGPWEIDSDNMLYWRALWRAMRAEFPDVLLGVASAEEVQDAEVLSVTINPDSQPSASIPPDAVTESQLAEIANLREAMANSFPTDSDAQISETWASLLNPFGVKSARDLKQIDADKFIAVVREKYMPF